MGSRTPVSLNWVIFLNFRAGQASIFSGATRPLGVHHGIFCVGNLGWMLALGTVMAVEKNMPWGRRISAPMGVGLIGWSLALVALVAFAA